MSNFAHVLKQLRIRHELTQKNIAAKLNVSQNAIHQWETGKTEPSQQMIERIAEYFNVSPAYLMGWDEPKETASKPRKKGVVINVYGRVAAGMPIDMIEDIIDTEEITEEMAKTGEFFGLQIKGESMEPKISEGDIVIVRRQDDAETGDTVIVSVSGAEATCKRLKKYRDGIELIATNPSYEPIFYSKKEVINNPVKILGKVVELRAKF